MKLFLRRNAPLFYALAAMLVLYIPWLNRGYLNWEWGTVLAGRGMSSSEDFFYLQAYKDSGHANPLGYPFLISLVHRVFGFSEVFWYSRVPGLVSALLVLIWGFHELHRRDKFTRGIFYSWAVLIILNPMIFAFATSATTDVPAAALFLLSMVFLANYCSKQKTKFVVFAALAMGLSSSVKYITPFFAPMVLIVFCGLFLKRAVTAAKLVRDVLIFGAISGSVLLVEILWKWENTGVLLSARNDEMAPNFLDLTVWLHTFGKYLAFLGLFCGLLPLAFVRKTLTKFRRPIFFAIGAVIIFCIGWVVSGELPEGELDFGGGFTAAVLIRRVLQVFGFAGATMLILVCIWRFKLSDVASRALMVGLLPYLILLSASRPTQRYLIYAIPIVLLILVEALDDLSKRTKYLAIASTAFGFAAVSLLGMSYLTSQGNASEEMAVWVEENSLISQTSAGVIRPHAGQHWWGVEADETRYEIISVTPSAEAQVKERVLHREPMKVLGKVTRVYLLREISTAP